MAPAGRQLTTVLNGVARFGKGESVDLAELAAHSGDERTALVLEPLKYALIMRPLFVVWEQVPTVRPVWEASAVVLREAGYSVDTDVLRAEQYGVPQIRRRAFLVARRDLVPAMLPEPTHSRFYTRDPTRLDPGVLPWVSMAEALGWGMTARPYPTIASGRTSGGLDIEKVGGSKARKSIYIERDAGRWIPGRDDDEERSRLSIAEAAILQTFPPDFPFQGRPMKQFTQVGNAVPPLLAEVILSDLIEYVLEG